MQFDADIDLSDIFAEYLNDTADPLATFSAYGNFQWQQTPSVTKNSSNGPTMALPTGGIRTAFHASHLSQVNPSGYYSQNDLSYNDSSSSNNNNNNKQYNFENAPIQTALQHDDETQKITLSAASLEYNLHASKKPRLDTDLAQHSNNMQKHQKQIAAVPANLSTSGITGRLGYSMQGGHLMMPRSQTSQNVNLAPAPSSIQLPIGVGIRVGGVGGANNINTKVEQLACAPQNPILPIETASFPMWAGSDTAGLTDQAIAERRQRNREHAKRSRVRKKFLLESLQAEVSELQAENERLRMLVQSKIPLHAQQIISECCAKNPLFEDQSSRNSGGITKNAGEKQSVELANSDYTLIKSLTSGQQNFVLSDPRLPDNPIVYASEGFYKLTGYAKEQVLGRNCRFLQGPDTDPKAVDVIRTAVANGTDATTCLLNYKADGTPFWNQFFIAALRDSDNCIVNYVSCDSSMALND
jgi:PAS domain S-box